MQDKKIPIISSKIFHWTWDSFVILCTAFFVIFTPLNLIYEFPLSPFLIGSNLAISAVFGLDVLITLLRIKSNRDPWEISLHESVPDYMRRWFVFDLLAFLPLGLVTGLPVLGIFRLLKLVKVARILNTWQHTTARLIVILRLMLSLFWILLITHWIACGWIALSEVINRDTWRSEYIDALYWSVTTVTTVGYGDVLPKTDLQKLYSIVTMISGLAFYGYLIGNVASLLFQKDPAHEAYLKNLDRLAVTSRYYELPPDLRKRVFDYFTNLRKRRRGHFETDFLNSLSGSLRREVSHHLRFDVLKRVPLFENADRKFLTKMSTLLKPLVVEPDTFLCRAGDEGNEMFFVTQGELQVIAPDGKTVVHVMSDGDYFGEIALFKNKPRTANVKSTTFCDLYELSRAALDSVRGDFPEFIAEIEQKALERDRKMANLDDA